MHPSAEDEAEVVAPKQRFEDRSREQLYPSIPSSKDLVGDKKSQKPKENAPISKVQRPSLLDN